MMNSPLVLEAATHTAAIVLAGWRCARGTPGAGAALHAHPGTSAAARRDRAVAGRWSMRPCRSRRAGPTPRIGGRRVGEGPGVGDPRPRPVLFDELPVSRLRRAAMFGSQTDWDFATGAPQGCRLRVRLPGLRGARLAGRRGRTEPARRQAAAFRRAGQAGDLHVHARRAQPGRYLRLQADAGEVLGQAGPVREALGLPTSRARRRPRCCARLPGNSPSTARAAAGSPSCSRTSPGTWTTCA